MKKKEILSPLEEKTGFAKPLIPKQLYIINYINLEQRYSEELKKYQNYPELIDINEFSKNYSFGYHLSNNIDDLSSREAMFNEIKNYLSNNQTAA